MCLLGIAVQTVPHCPLFVMANREEAYSRPSADPLIFSRNGDFPAWLGGTDLLAGGTWLGINEYGLVAAVTNRRKSAVPENPPSRGQLCRSLLQFTEPAAAVAETLRQLREQAFAGCNIVLAHPTGGVIVEAGDELKMKSLGPGIHWVTNGPVDDAQDRRVLRAIAELEEDGPLTLPDWARSAMRLCALRAEGDKPPICLEGTNGGTVSSTILAVTTPREHSLAWFSPGPPARTEYRNISPSLRRLFRGDIGEHTLHRIQLRGPWTATPLARFVSGTTEENRWSSDDLPGPSTVTLPADWRDLFGEFRGRIRFERRFHKPTNLDPQERAVLVVTAVQGRGEVRLNGAPLGPLLQSTSLQEFDITDHLRGSDLLQIELEMVDLNPESPSGLYAPIALEIRALASEGRVPLH